MVWLAAMLAKLKLLSLPVSQAMFLGFVLGISIEGTLDRNFGCNQWCLQVQSQYANIIIRFSSKTLIFGGNK